MGAADGNMLHADVLPLHWIFVTAPYSCPGGVRACDGLCLSAAPALSMYCFADVLLLMWSGIISQFVICHLNVLCDSFRCGAYGTF